MDKEKFIAYLEYQMKIYRELGEDFKQRLYALENIYREVLRGEFDIK